MRGPDADVADAAAAPLAGLPLQPLLNFHHLHYFWVVAHSGGMARAAERLGVAVQTVSAQVRALEQALGVALLKPAGRGLVLTPAGRAACEQADQIFQLGAQLPALLQASLAQPVQRLQVGVSDGLSKLVVHQLLQPVLDAPALSLLCREAEFDQLLAELALHRLDVVLADRPAPPNPNLRLASHALGSSPLWWFGTPALLQRAGALAPPGADDEQALGAALAALPLLLPTGHAAVRPRLDQWFARHGLQPRVAGEFEDSALLKTFGASGLGLFPAPQRMATDLQHHYGVLPLGPCEGVSEHVYAIATRRKVEHPLVRRVVDAGAGAAAPQPLGYARAHD